MMADRKLQDWALPQISRILPLDDESLQQIVAYADSLSKTAAAEHLKEILGDSPQALEFISSFNSRRQSPGAMTEVVTSQPTSSRDVSSRDVSESEVPRVQKSNKKKSRAPLHSLPARQIDTVGDVKGGYMKRDEEDYIPTKARAPRKEAALANTLALEDRSAVKQKPVPELGMHTHTQATQLKPKSPPSAAGPLITDALSPKPSRSSSPAKGGQTKATAKVNMTGGTSMRGQSSTLSDLDSAIRSLEMQTNPSISVSDDTSKRRCECMAQRHALLTAAPNCTSCGKIICAKEGLGPCTFCGTPLLAPADLQAMIAVLREERGHERQQANNAAHRRAQVSKTPRPFTSSNPVSAEASADNDSGDDSSSGLAAAKRHRDRLLRFQAENARRTRIHDEAADFDTPDVGQSQWASPAERARQLKRQQAVLRAQEWQARPEWERRRVVASIDVVGGKAVRRMQELERPATPESDSEETAEAPDADSRQRGGAFRRNPLLQGGLVRPMFVAPDSELKGKDRVHDSGSRWRRVQDDGDGDNEAWILDGGVYGPAPIAEDDGCG